MKITICEPCKRVDSKIVETDRLIRVKGRAFLNMDMCENHATEAKKKSMVEYVRYVFEIRGSELKETDSEIEQKFLTRFA